MKPRDVQLFQFYNEVGKKHPGSKVQYKYGYAITRARTLKQFLRLNKKAFTLDLGCGDGYYKPSIPRYVGLDAALGYLKRFKGARVWAIGQFLPFKNNSFDRIFMSEVLEHIWNREQVLDECYRVLKKTGILILSTPIGRSPFKLRDSWTTLRKYDIAYCPYIHGHFSVRYTKKILRKSRFIIKRLEIIRYRDKPWFIATISRRIN